MGAATASINGKAAPGKSIPYFPSAADALGRQGFARIVNLSNRDGEVSITAFDDSGRQHGPVTLTLDALETVHFNSGDLEDGNAGKGLAAGVGRPTEGDWRLELTSALDLKVLSYIRTSDGFVTSMHDLAPSDANSHRIAFFNPGSNFRQESLLRMVNPGSGAASVSIRGVDDKGAAAPGGTVRLSIPPGAARTFGAAQLEDGAAGLTGRLGDGAGKWRLTVTADVPIQVMSLLATPTGHLTNLSTAPGGVDPGDSPSDGRLPAPAVEVTGDREFTVSWRWSGTAQMTYAFDLEVRIDGGGWQGALFSGDCPTATFDDTIIDTFVATIGTSSDISAGTVIEARYRYRNGSSCTSGPPGDWSEVGKHTVPGGGGGTQAPDLVVESASVDDNSPETGDSFTLKATVRNRGDGPAAATTLRYYRSSNSTISANDTAIGTDAVARLAASATGGESISLIAPSSAGTYHYGACVDSVSGESSTANNCSTGVKVDVSAPQEKDSCTVDLRRSVRAGGVERVALVQTDAVRTEVGTTETPVVMSAGMDARLDHDIYQVTLDARSRLLVLGTGDLDTEAVAVTDECTRVGSVARDVGSLPDADPGDQNFLLSADLDAGTYYILVFEWASRQGDYGLEFALGDEVSQVPLVGAISDQEVSLGDTATVFVPVEDVDGDLRHVAALAEDPNTMVAWVRLRSGAWQLVLNPVAPGTTTVHLLATDRRVQAGLTSFNAVVPASASPAPEVASGDADGRLTITFEAALEARERRAYDLQLRGSRPLLPWQGVGCVEFENASSDRVMKDLMVVVDGLRHGLLVDARYRSRESSSCGTGSPVPWSAPGSGTIAGTPVNDPPAFDGAGMVERRIDENAGGGLDVGAPVVAQDPDGVRDQLTYSLRGPDADSFHIVPGTGQIRTLQDVGYDYESKSDYRVDVEVVDVFGERDRTPVTIAVRDLEANCAAPEDVRLNAGDGRLWARWSPVAQDSRLSAVLGYEIEYRAGTTGSWTRLALAGQSGGLIEITGLINDLAYWVRVRPVGDESECDWSTPVEGSPTTDRAPRNSRDFNDRFRPHDRLGGWSFPVPGRCAEHRDEQIDCSYEYEKTGPHRGMITLEYDDGSPGCAVGLLFSSLTAGSFLDQCGGAGVAGLEVPFKIEPPPESGLAPQSRSEFDQLVFSNSTVLPEFLFGQWCRGPVCNRIKINGKPAGEPVHPGWVSYSAAGASQTRGRYWYEATGLATGRLEVEIIQGGHCIIWGDQGCEVLEEGDRLRFLFDLKFDGSDLASFTRTVYRNGVELSSDSGLLDFQKDSPRNRLPRELVPPRASPQAAGRDHSEVMVAAPTTISAVAGDSLLSVLVRDAGIQPVAYRPGDWLEPKDGSNQRMMIVGADHGPSTVAVSAKRSPLGGSSAALAIGEPEYTRLAVVCMQQDNAIPVRGSRFFSWPKTASGFVQTCQRDCVLADGKAMQACVWDCEDSIAEFGANDGTSGKSTSLRRLGRAGALAHSAGLLETGDSQKRPTSLVRPGGTVTVTIGGPL